MVQIKITACSKYCRDILLRNEAGKIHSIYQRTVNLDFSGILLSLQSADTQQSPLSLTTELSKEAFAALNVFPDQPVEIRDQKIRFSGYVFDFSRSEIWDPTIHGDPRMAEFASCVLSSLPGKHPLSDIVLGHAPSEASLMDEEFCRIIASADSLFRQSRFDDAVRELSQMIGLGEGLTPSGDDFLCGFLASTHMNFHPRREQVREALTEYLGDLFEKTNTISAGFLDCAVKGFFSRPVIELADMDLIKSVEAFSKIGHSSGADTLSGIVYGVRALS